jgi:hypothetical protein
MEEVHVREPIKYKSERLVTTHKQTNKHDEYDIAESILMADIEQALRQSSIDHENMWLKEQEKREKRLNTLSKFKNIRHQLKRIGTFDKDILKLNELLVPIIELYCEDTNRIFTFDKETFEMIIKNIRTIRLKPEEYQLILGMIHEE